MPATLEEILRWSGADCGRYPIWEVNLACAGGLPDTRELDTAACSRALFGWVQHVRRETERHLYLFRRSPEEYENCEGYFRILMMITVLQQDCGVRYDPASVKTTRFQSSGEGFIPGLLDGRGLGTCSNLPVLYVSVGRLLGYPLHLCLANGHVFCRWEDDRDRFNIEASGSGLCTPSDDYYLKWPKPISREQLKRVPFLRNMSRSDETALFIATRGHCLVDAGRHAEAVEAFEASQRLAPDDPHYRAFLADAQLRQFSKEAREAAGGQYLIVSQTEGLP